MILNRLLRVGFVTAGLGEGSQERAREPAKAIWIKWDKPRKQRYQYRSYLAVALWNDQIPNFLTETPAANTPMPASRAGGKARSIEFLLSGESLEVKFGWFFHTREL